MNKEYKDMLVNRLIIHRGRTKSTFRNMAKILGATAATVYDWSIKKRTPNTNHCLRIEAFLESTEVK
jgi:DNA-binding XRE family transcriptional regulator